MIGTFGIFETAAGLVSGALPSTRWFLLGHGIVSVLFGVLTASVPVASLPRALTLATVWLALNAGFNLLLAVRRWERLRDRLALLGWGAVNAACAVALVLAPPSTTLALLYAGAVYAFTLGVAQLVGCARVYAATTHRALPTTA